MTQTPFDQMSKQYLEEFLAPFGVVQRQYEIPGEAKFVDVWFVPDPEAIAQEDLGLLGQMIQKPCLFLILIICVFFWEARGKSGRFKEDPIRHLGGSYERCCFNGGWR